MSAVPSSVVSSRSSSFDLYQTITDQILGMLDTGVIPWRSPILGRSSAGIPKNLNTGKPYRGVNVFLLAFAAYAKGWDSSYYLTFNQIRERGGNVRKGEKSSMVVFWKQYETKDRVSGEPVKVPVLKYYNVFNAAAQCDGIDVPDKAVYTPSTFTPSEEAEKIVKGYADGPAIIQTGASAYYRPSTDEIYIPEPTRFTSTEEYYSTLLHEQSHSTGHEKRLDRKLAHGFGSTDYGKEELIAEMSAAFLCGHCGLSPVTIENTAAYLNGWMKAIKQDKKLVISSAGASQRSADWILGSRGQVQEEVAP